MNDFESAYHDYLHRISIDPLVKRVETLQYSDTVLHLPVLEYYASLCWNCAEFGCREGNSTLALLAGCKGEVHSYDIERSMMVAWLHQRREQLPCRWIFHQASTSDPNLDLRQTEFLFIDTLHTYEHVKKELSLHGRKATRFLAFHDSHTCAYRDISGNDPNERGILPAIEEFLEQFPGEYSTVYRTRHNNGLWILQRHQRAWRFDGVGF